VKVPSLVAIALLVCPVSSPADDAMSPRLAALEQALKAGGDATPFWLGVDNAGTPLIERLPGRDDEVRVTFLWQAENASEDVNVSVVAPFNEDDAPTTRRLTHMAGSDVWYRGYTVDPAARFTYSLAWPAGRVAHPDAIRRQAWEGTAYELFSDPKCRRSILGVFFDENAPYSYFEGPEAPAEPWLAARAAAPKGRVRRQTYRSAILDNTRDVDVYLPPGYREHRGAYPFVVLFDGNSYLWSASLPTQLDNLIADGAIPPLVAFLVGRIGREHRNRELPPNPEFARFVAEELMPALRREYRLSASPREAVIGGASYGALAATAIAQRYPQVFGNVLSQSGSYWWHPGFKLPEDDAFRRQIGWLPRTFASGPRLPLRFYLEVGRSESANMLVPNRFFRDLLAARGYAVEYREFAGGHEHVSWRDGVARGLASLLGPARR
jgi:enterochelin esterase family protein